MIKEKSIKTPSGYLMIPILLLLLVSAIGTAILLKSLFSIIFILLAMVATFCLTGFFMVHPNTGRILQLFGNYVGTEKRPGLRWANPLYTKRRVSLRIRNFESDKLKVNDNRGNPIEIAAVVVWSVVDTAEAIFEVDNYESFVSIQSEAALRNMATSYPYDQHEEGEVALRSHANDVSQALRQEIQDRLDKAGVQVIESRISHLAYAPEIASAMLQRQQASAIIAAREKIVEGAVGMVQMALEKLHKDKVVEMDEERKAAMVSNLLVVLCSEKSTQPVVNSGSLYT